MRFIAALAPGIAILVVVYLLARGPQPPSPAQVSARDRVEALAREHLAALASGNGTKWAVALGTNGRFVPSTGRRFVVGADNAAEIVAREPGMPLAAADSTAGVRIGMSRRGRMAWMVSMLGRKTTEGPSAKPLRVTAAWYRRDDAWHLMLEHHSRPVTEADIASRGGLEVEPANGLVHAVPAQSPAEGPRPGILGRPHKMVRLFLKQIAQLSRARVESETILLGPTDGELAAGDSAAKALLGEWEQRYGKLTADEATLVSWTPRRIGVGWIVADLTARPPGPGGAVRLRMSAVYRERGEDSWSLVMAHLCDPAAAGEDSLPPAAVAGGRVDGLGAGTTRRTHRSAFSR